MDERQLKEVLDAERVPPPDENARKRAVNLALAAFDDAQREKHEKEAQGKSVLGRLIGRSKAKSKGRPMLKRFVFGPMAAVTALLIVFVGGGALMVKGWMSAQQNALVDARRKAIEATPAPTRTAPSFAAPTQTAQAKNERDEAERTTSGLKQFRADGKEEAAKSAPMEMKRAAPARSAGTRRTEMLDMAANAPATSAAAPVAREMQAEQAPVAASPPAPAPSVAGLEKRDTLLRARKDLEGRKVAPSRQSVTTTDAWRPQGFAAGQGVAAKPRPAALPDDRLKRQYEAVGRDKFADVEENGVKRVAEAPVSTFSVDVDTASYSFVRRELKRGVLPRKNAVRVEELVNYFDYDYPLAATRERPFQPTVTVMPSPWKKGNKLIHIGIKGYDIDAAEKPRSNLVFLLDVSGSMNAPDKLPLMVNSLKLLLDRLGPDDTVAIVTYAGRAGTVLEPTKVAEKRKILAALDRLRSGGSTAGAAGIRQAYALAESTFDKNAVNRVILATDGDFNVGITNRDELKGFIERKRKTGVFLSVLGFGQGNLNDRLMQALAQNGNGVAAHIDTLNEARKVLVDEASSTLFPIAKDVKIQVEFNPAAVAEYRLIGYETRALKREDFNNDKVDAGDIGAGHRVTAIYEITPVGGPAMIADSRYARRKDVAKPSAPAQDHGSEYAFLKIRYKLPKEEVSKLIATPIAKAHEIDGGADLAPARAAQLREARWATAVAAFGQILKGGKYTGDYTLDDVIALARTARGDDEFGYRAEFINLVRLARSASALPR